MDRKKKEDAAAYRVYDLTPSIEVRNSLDNVEAEV